MEAYLNLRIKQHGRSPHHVMTSCYCYYISDLFRLSETVVAALFTNWPKLNCWWGEKSTPDTKRSAVSLLKKALLVDKSVNKLNIFVASQILPNVVFMFSLY